MAKQQVMSMQEQLQIAADRMSKARGIRAGRHQDEEKQEQQEPQRYQKPTPPEKRDPQMSTPAPTSTPTSASANPQSNPTQPSPTPQPAPVQIDPQVIEDLRKQIEQLAAHLSEKKDPGLKFEDLRKEITPLVPAKAGEPYFLLPDQDLQMKVHRERRRSRRADDQLNFDDAPKKHGQHDFFASITTPDGEKYTIPLTEDQRDRLFELKAKTLQSANVMQISQTALQTLGAISLGIGIVFGIRAQTKH